MAIFRKEDAVTSAQEAVVHCTRTPATQDIRRIQGTPCDQREERQHY